MNFIIKCLKCSVKILEKIVRQTLKEVAGNPSHNDLDIEEVM